MRARQGTTGIRWTLLVATAAFLAGAAANVQAQRDRGVNQPGAAGNTGVGGAAGVGGSARQTRAVGDPGVNQPGAAGNAAGGAGRDPGVNQPGATGNRR